MENAIFYSTLHFLKCNLYLTGIFLTLFALIRIFQKSLTSETIYRLWICFCSLLILPFLPEHLISLTKFINIASHSIPEYVSGHWMKQAYQSIHNTPSAQWMNDFTISVEQTLSASFVMFLLILWMTGILLIFIYMLKSCFRFYQVKKSALIIENEQLFQIYTGCLNELHISSSVPIYGSVNIHSAIQTGVFYPAIYLPIEWLYTLDSKNWRYIFLHELQHYKRKDNILNFVLNFIQIVYWFNPCIWFALDEIKNSREIACDSSVLSYLNKSEYFEYGNTLLRVLEYDSQSRFSFGAGIHSSMRSMKKRIVNIISHERKAHQSFIARIKNSLSVLLVFILFICSIPQLTANAMTDTLYSWDTSNVSIKHLDFSDYFADYSGCFVLYHEKSNQWMIYNYDQAIQRISPDSTYKIYAALLGLESGIITPEHSEITWNGNLYPFDLWNKNQDLNSAMTNSVNWYFDAIDTKLGISAINNFIQKIEYGNQNITGSFPAYWLESSLKISSIEQVLLLEKFNENHWHFDEHNISATKKSLSLSETSNAVLYGKTGTGAVNQQNINGWFVGFVESSNDVWYFATNIRASENASGTAASEITLNILTDMNILK